MHLVSSFCAFGGFPDEQCDDWFCKDTAVLSQARHGVLQFTADHSKVSACLPCSWELKALGDYHQHLLKMRLEGGLEGIEMGPILGRGSFGRVYKGALHSPLRSPALRHPPSPAASDTSGAWCTLSQGLLHCSYMAVWSMYCVTCGRAVARRTGGDQDRGAQPEGRSCRDRGRPGVAAGSIHISS